MWFKQLSFYPLNKDKLPTKEELQEALSDAAFSPCQGLDWFSEGFAAPVSFDQDLVFAANNSLRVALKKEEKVLPSTVIKDILDDKITSIEQEELRQIGRKEKQALKEQITDDLLPRAFTRSGKSQALFDLERGLLLINNASSTKAEALLSKLRQALGGLEASLPRTQMSPSALMTDWLLAGEAAGTFELDSDCELKGTGDLAPTVRISKQDLTAEEVSHHIKNGKTVTQLGLIWDDRIRFVLTSDLTLKRIQFLDVLQEEASSSGDDMPSLVQASQIIMCESLGALLAELVLHLGNFEEK